MYCILFYLMSTFNFSENTLQQAWFYQVTPENMSINCPVLFTASAVYIYLNDSTIWQPKVGAYMERRVRSGLVVGGGFDAKLDNSRKIMVNEPHIFSFDVQCEYGLSFDFKVYAATLSIWQYVPPTNL